MLQNNIQMSYFISQLKTVINTMVVKRDKVANAFERDLESIKEADRYINTIEFGDDWNTYVLFDSDILIAAGLDKNLLSYFMQSKENIPRELRSKVVQLQKEKIINQYVEKNDYYLMLAGQPPYGTEEKDFLYAPENSFGVPTNIPIHKLSVEYVGFLRASGILDKLIEANPNKKYLNFLADKAISYYTARTANNYDILYIDKSKVENNIFTDFKIFYDKARAYYMIALFNKDYANMFVWYDEFMGLLILTMAVQRLISNVYKQGLTRDFYDVELIKYLFKSYSIPYIEEMELKYQRLLAKSMNYMLQYKSTDKVLYDVAYLLGFYNVNIYKYYLVKTQKMNNEGNPLFVYDENHDPVYEFMYNFHFQKVNLKDKDINIALTDTKNSMDYNTIILEDPYWVDDDELKKKLYETNFNNTLTKYMSLDVAYKIVEMMYEVSHTLRMFIDNQKDFKLITVEIPSIGPNPISLFDLTIFLCCLGSAKMGLKGSIPIKGYQIPSVYGFNYKADLEKLREEIYNNEEEYSKIDPSLVNYILNMRATTVNDVDRLYSNITAFRKIITRYLFLTKDKETYFQYKKLYKALLLTEDVEELYKDTNGNIQDTYQGLLEKNNPELYTIFKNIEPNKNTIEDYIDDIFIKLSTLSIEYKYLASINRNDILFEFIMKLIRFFKSYTVDFVNSGIQYFLDDRYLMGLKLLETWEIGEINSELRDSLMYKGNWYKDYLERVTSSFDEKDTIRIEDWIKIYCFLRQDDFLLLYDRYKEKVEVDVREQIISFIDNIESDKDIEFHDKDNINKNRYLLRDWFYQHFIFMVFNFDEKNLFTKETLEFDTVDSGKGFVNIVDDIQTDIGLKLTSPSMVFKDKLKINIDESEV